MSSFFTALKRRLYEFILHLRGKGNTDQESIKQYLVKGVTGSIGTRLVSVGLAFLTSVFWARILGPEGYGIYSYIFAIITVIVIPTQLGLPRLIVREVAAYQANQSWNYLKGILKRANQFINISGGVLFVLGYLFLYFVPNFFKDSITQKTFLYALPLLIFMPNLAIRAYALRGLKEVVLSLISEKVIKSIILVVSGSIVLILGSKFFTPYRFMMLVSVSFLIGLLIAFVFLQNKLPENVKQAKPSYQSKRWIKSMWPFLLMGGLSIINSKIDLVLLGSLGTNEGVGLYRVAMQIANLVTITLASVNIVVAPLFSSLWTKGKMVQLQKVLTKSAQAVFVITLPIALVLIFGGKWILMYVFGTEFSAAATALAIICIGYLFNALMGSVGELLNMCGYENKTALALAISAIINIILNILLIPEFGIEGAALASLISTTAWNSLLGWYVYKKLNLIPSIYAPKSR